MGTGPVIPPRFGVGRRDDSRTADDVSVRVVGEQAIRIAVVLVATAGRFLGAEAVSHPSKEPEARRARDVAFRSDRPVHHEPMPRNPALSADILEGDGTPEATQKSRPR